jgi:hypothetical protein
MKSVFIRGWDLLQITRAECVSLADVSGLVTSLEHVGPNVFRVDPQYLCFVVRLANA